MAVSSDLADFHESFVHGCITGDFVPGSFEEGRIRSAPVVSALQPRRALTEPVQHEYTVRTDLLGDLHAQARRTHAAGHLYQIAIGNPRRLRRNRIDPEAVLGSEVEEPWIARAVGVGVEGLAAEHQAEPAGWRLRRRLIDGERIVTSLF